MQAKSIAIVTVLAFLAIPSTSAAAPSLTVIRAKAAMRANAALDRPAAITVTDCRRTSHVRIVCTVNEKDAHTFIEDNGEPVITDGWGWWRTEARIVRGHIFVAIASLAYEP